MATFKLGALVTEIVGSIGGTTLKRNGSYKVIMNKPTGSAYGRLLQNSALSYLGFIFKAWTGLSDGEKGAWNTQALSFTFPDKFGTLRNLTGRQLFIKLNAQRYIISRGIIDAESVNSTLIPFTLAPTEYTPLAPAVTVNITGDAVGDVTYLVSVEISLQPLRSPTYVSRKTIISLSGDATTTYDILPALLLAYPYWTGSYNTRVYIEQLNDSGFKSVMQSSNMIVIE